MLDKFRLRYFKNRLSIGIMFLFVVIVSLLFVAIPLLLFGNSCLVIQENSLVNMLFSSQWQPEDYIFGFLPAIAGTFYVTLLSIVVAVPISILSAIYISEYAPRKLRIYLQGFIDVLAGIPSVVFGICALLILLPFVSNYLGPLFNVETTGICIFTAAIVLAVMIFPIIISLSVESLCSIPLGLKEQALAPGATKWQMIHRVLLKAAGPGIISAIVLGLGRAFGETMAVAMVIGGKNQLPRFFQAGQTLPSLIVNSFGEMMSVPMERSALIFGALFLFVVVTFFNLLAAYLKNKLKARWRYE